MNFIKKTPTSLLTLPIIGLLLTTVAFSSNSTVESPSETPTPTALPRPTPSSPMPALIPPVFDNPSLSYYMTCSLGCGNHTDSGDPKIKTYYAYDILAADEVNGTAPFKVRAAAGGTVDILVRKMRIIGTPQDGCPEDADPNTKDSKEGYIVTIGHGGGWYTYYIHLSAIDVVQGATVKQGDPIGTAGCTGANVVHLHFDIRWLEPSTGIYWTYPAPFPLPDAKPTPVGAPVDLAFVIDTTGSMRDDIDGVKTYASDIIDNLYKFSANSHVGIVQFRDYFQRTYDSADFPARNVLPLTFDPGLVKQAIGKLAVAGGGDDPESQYCALMHAINGDSCLTFGDARPLGIWRDKAQKAIIVISDAPPLSPEPFTGFTRASVIAAAKAGGITVIDDPLVSEASSVEASSEHAPIHSNAVLTDSSIYVHIYPIVIGNNSVALDNANEIATDTGGKVFTATNPAEVVQAITSIINIIAPKVSYLPAIANGSGGESTKTPTPTTIQTPTNTPTPTPTSSPAPTSTPTPTGTQTPTSTPTSTPTPTPTFTPTPTPTPTNTPPPLNRTRTVSGNAVDAEVGNGGAGCANWNTCRDATAGTLFYQDATIASVSASYWAYEPGLYAYGIKRVLLYFDSLLIPPNATVTGATLHVHAGTSLSGNSTIHVVSSTASYPSPSVADFGKVILTSGGSVTVSPDVWVDIPLNALALNWITKGGVTKLALAHHFDVSNAPPTSSNDVVVFMSDDSTYRPYLTVNYTLPYPCPRKGEGDANCDGVIDGIDYSIWLDTQCSPAPGQQCADLRADFNFDQRVDGVDYTIWLANYNT